MEGLSPEFAGSKVETRYQPIVRMHDGSLAGLEALARLRHPDRGVLEPQHFVQQIEAAGFGCALTLSIFARAMRDARERQSDVSRCHVAVNVPLDVLLSPSTVVNLTALRNIIGLDAGIIHIELTESRPVADIGGLGQAIERMRAAGFDVALDDYAPSMAFCAELLDLPFASVKFDHLLVAAAAKGGPDAAFMADSIEAAHRRGLDVTAEGVEDEPTWRRLHAMGVDCAQGFWISRPLPIEEVEPWRLGWAAAQA